jgi:TM2 domain-containing membrane protein YozV
MINQSKNQTKNRETAIALALAGVLLPGLHKFYLGQPKWGVLYLLLYATFIPQIASAFEGLWYVLQGQEGFNRSFNLNLASSPTGAATAKPGSDPVQVGAIADALRQLESLRQDGLLSEYEFEQKRRHLLDQIG